MDIRKHAVSETGSLHLRDAAGRLMYDEKTKQPVTVTVYGPGSKQYAKAQAEKSSRLIDRMKEKGKDEVTAEEAAEDKAQFLAGCTHSMQNVEYEGLQGDALHRAVYGDHTIGFVADQVAQYASNWANFTKGSQPA